MDEVGNLAPETQQMLLRAIQERRYRPVGDRTDRSFNVRIIAATNENLEKAVNESVSGRTCCTVCTTSI